MSEKKSWTHKVKIGEKTQSTNGRGTGEKVVAAYVDDIVDEALAGRPKINPLKVAALVEKRVKARDEIWGALEKIIDAFAETYHQALRHDLDTYQMLTNPDCLYGTSPISEAYLRHWVKQYLFLKDLSFLSGLQLDGKPSIKTLTERATESSKWIMRFTKEPEAPKTGAEKILKGG